MLKINLSLSAFFNSKRKERKMKKWKCKNKECRASCVIYTKNCAPQRCVNIVINGLSAWQEVKEEMVTDCSRLPDWVKKCAIGYDNEQERYFEVTNIDKKWVDIEYLDDGIGATCDYSDIQNCSEARKRPFNEKEMQGLVGKVIETKNQIAIVIGCIKNSNRILLGNDNFLSAEQLINLEATSDGKPCYVLEHLENGEWVE
jgi:hypothetical protein